MISNCGLGSERIYVSRALFCVAEENNVSGALLRPKRLFFASVNFENNECDVFDVVDSSFTVNDCIDDEAEDLPLPISRSFVE